MNEITLLTRLGSVGKLNDTSNIFRSTYLFHQILT